MDEQFGADILRDAAERGYVTACPAEKSGQDEFDFEYGDDFARHIETFRPTFCKVLVRYNPEGDAAMNRRQTDRLKRLSDYLHAQRARPVHVRAAGARNAGAARAVRRRQEGIRPGASARADGAGDHELQDAGIEPDVWKIEGIDRPRIAAGSSRPRDAAARDHVGCIVLGRGEDDVKVRQWLKTAAAVPGFIGFAVGRTSFWGPLTDWKDGRIAREAAVVEIARRYREWVDIFEAAGAESGAAAPRGGGA